MALIKCSECDKEISENAKTCPHCGAKHETEEQKQTRIIAGVVIGIISILLFLSGFSGIVGS